MQGEGAEPGKETEERQQMIRSASARVDGMEWVSAVWCGMVWCGGVCPGMGLLGQCWGIAWDDDSLGVRIKT